MQPSQKRAVGTLQPHNSADDLVFPLRRSAQLVEADPEGAKAAFHAQAEQNAPKRPGLCSNCGVRHRKLSAEQCQDRQMLEKTLQDRIVDRAKRRGWKTAHVGKGIAGFTKDGQPIFVTAMAPGWPDLTLAKEGHALIFFECKKELGEVSDDQRFWIDLLNRCGARAVVIRPSHLREGVVTAILNEGYPLG